MQLCFRKVTDWIWLRLRMTAVALQKQTCQICACHVIRQKYVDMKILVSVMHGVSKTQIIRMCILFSILISPSCTSLQISVVRPKFFSLVGEVRRKRSCNKKQQSQSTGCCLSGVCNYYLLQKYFMLASSVVTSWRANLLIVGVSFPLNGLDTTFYPT